MGGMMLMLVLVLLYAVHTVAADDALVLPQGRWYVSAEARFSLPITRRFTPEGGTEDLATDFNRELNSTVFPDVRLVEAAFRLPEGSATFGRSVVAFEQHIQIYTMRAAYGLTDRLSVGVRVPYWTQENQVQAALDSRTATVGFNPAVPGGIAPLGVPGTRPPTTEDIQAFVERLGFRRVETWSDASFGDSFAGLKYQYFQSEHWRLAATGRVRFPTGRWDDPNNLVDFPTGFDAWGLALELHQDVVWQRPGLTRQLGVLTTGEFVLNTRFQYEALFPDTKPFRVCPIHQPICPHFDPQVHRDLGDLVEAEIAGTVGLLPGLTLRPMYTYTHKFQDQFRGERGFDYGQLQAQTATDFHTLELRLAYHTGLLVAQQRFPVPLSLEVRYMDRIAGTNNRLVIRTLGVILAATW
jgi:hypothetical protein